MKIQRRTEGVEKSDGTETREAIRATEKKRAGEAAPLSAGRQTAGKTFSKEKIYG